MCYQVNLPNVTRKHTIIASKDTIVKDRNNRGGDTEDAKMYSRSSFLITGSTSTSERCGTTKNTNITKAHTILW
jgi:hypothetical protein